MGLSGVSSDSWWANLLPAIHAPDTPNNRNNLNAWQSCEGADAAFNPFNTTLDWPGATLYNSAGVKNYPNFQAGWSATASTINQSNMSNIRYALQHNLNRASFATAIGEDPWGTSAACVRTASGGGSGGVNGPPGPIGGGGQTPPPPKERNTNDYSPRINRTAAQFHNVAHKMSIHARYIGNLREK